MEGYANTPSSGPEGLGLQSGNRASKMEGCRGHRPCWPPPPASHLAVPCAKDTVLKKGLL